MKYFELAIIGATASGKSALGVEIAKAFGGVILSLDSLSVYKEIDIASAKPSKKERSLIPHYGIDLLYPNEYFSAIEFAKLYKKISKRLKKEKKPLIITGGSSFYLKMLLDGFSPSPKISSEIKTEVEKILLDKKKAFEKILKIDKNLKIAPNDQYRIKKALEIYFATNLPPSRYFEKNPPKPIIKNLPIFEIVWEKKDLRQRVVKRTKKMFELGLIDEVAFLESKYKDRSLTSLKAIGIKEVLDYFDGVYSKEKLEEKIITNTLKLAKRQTTFNRSQFKNIKRGSFKEIKNIILASFGK